jgi:hypothetical protein
MKTPRLHPAFLAAFLLALPACASAPQGLQSGPMVRHQANRISLEELQNNVQVSNLLELVQMLRPAWLRGRGVERIQNATSVQVYYDETRLGGPDALRNIRVEGVKSLQFFDAPEATLRWGIGNSQGAILVRTH